MRAIFFTIMIVTFASCASKKVDTTENQGTPEQYQKILQSEHSRDQFTDCLRLHKKHVKRANLYDHDGLISVVFDFQVDPAGEVRNLKIYPDTRSLAPLNQCLFFAFQKLQFPKSPENKVNHIRHSLKFSFR